jgi:hypothetical protein
MFRFLPFEGGDVALIPGLINVSKGNPPRKKG